MNPVEHRELLSFMAGERLKVDGSNFVDWYLRLRTSLKRVNILFIIERHVGDPPDNNGDEQEMVDYYVRQQKYFVVKDVMEHSMSHELSNQFRETSAYDMIDTLKSMFIFQFRVARFELEKQFLSTKMEENTCLKTHLAKMHGIHLSLVEDFDYWTTNKSTIEEFAINAVLHSLPLSYNDYVHGYVGRGYNTYFRNFMINLLDAKVAPIEGEIVDGEGIFDILIINVCSLIQHLQFNYENMTCRCMDGKRCN